jgi:hypothetical protein
MGREIKRVPLDFDYPIGEVWSGFLTPESLHEEKCRACDGTGYSAFAKRQQDRWYGYVPFSPEETGSAALTAATPAVRAFAERNVAHSPSFYGRGEWAIVREASRLADLWNGMWSHHLSQLDVDALVEGGRLYDFTHTFVAGDGWQPIEPKPQVTAEQVNLWSLSGFGHDSINCWVAVKAACERAGMAESCAACEGHGSTEKYEGQRAEAEAWESTGPPEGEGWQLWSTTTEGHPASPVFATPEELARWMSVNPCGFAGATFEYEVALEFITGDGWSPSMIGTSAGIQDGINALASGGAR